MDDAPSSGEGESGQATTARPSTMSTLAAAHLLQKLFHIISTTPPSREHSSSPRPPSQQSSSSQRTPGVTLAQMARHNLATSKPFIAHSLRLSIQQLAAPTQKRSIQPQALVSLNTTKKEPEDSEYYDSEYADEDNEVLTITQPKAMASTTVAAVLPAPSSTTERERLETTSLPSQTKSVSSSTTAQPTTTGDLEYGDSSADSDYPNDGNEVPNSVVTSLEARKSFLLSLLKERLTRVEDKKPSPTSTTAAPQTTRPTKSTTSSTSSTTRSETTTSTPSPTFAQTRAKNSTHLSSEYYDEDEDYMEDEPANSSDFENKEGGTGLVAKKPPAATAKRHVALMQHKMATWDAKNDGQSKTTTGGVLFKGLASGDSQFPSKIPLNQALGTKGVASQVLNRNVPVNVGLPARLPIPHTLMQTTITNRIPTIETSTPKPSSTTTKTLTARPTFMASQLVKALEKRKLEAITQRTIEKVTPTTSETLPIASAVLSSAMVPSATSRGRQNAVLSVNRRPWLLAARNQTVHLTPISSNATTDPVSPVNPTFNPLVSSPEDYPTEKVPQLIVKVYEPIDLKIVFCPKSCDQDHDHKYGKSSLYYHYIIIILSYSNGS